MPGVILSAALCLLPVTTGAATRRVQFPRGSSWVTLKGTVKENEEVKYVLRARKGQTLTATLTSTTPNHDVVFSINGPGGQPLTGDDVTTEWKGKLPKSGDYQISIGMIESKVSQYTLKINLR